MDFFVNVPIGVLAIFVTLTRIQESRDPNTRRVDWIGFVSFSGALFMLVFALVRGNDDGWGSTLIVGLLVGAVLLLVVFLVAEWRQADPMLDLTLFKRPAMVGVSLAAFTIAASIFAMFLYLTLFIQDDLGFGPLAAGIRFLPITMLAFIVAPFAGKLTVRINARYLLGTGMFLIAVGCLLMATTHASSGWTVLLPGFVAAGIGIGTVNPVLASSAISVVPPQRSGMASGANNTFRQVGIATGIAGLGAVFQSQIESRTLGALHSSPSGQVVISHGGAALQGALAGGGVRGVLPSIPSRLGAHRPARCLPHRIFGHPRPSDGHRCGHRLHRLGGFLRPGAPARFRTQPGPPSRRRSGLRSGGRRRAGRCTTMTLTHDQPAQPTEEPVSRKPGRPRDQRVSSAITAAALRQLADLGYANVSMESVAIEAGVARATIYRRYRDKADLITAAIAANSSARLVPGSETDARADLIECLEEFDARFAESCLEVVGTLIGARDDPGAMALHRERVVAPGWATSAICSSGPGSRGCWVPKPMWNWPSRC